MRIIPTKLLCLMLVPVLLTGVLFAFPLSASAEESPYTASGSCGVDENSDVEWFAFKDNSMAIFGNGPIRNYEYDSVNNISTAPWYGHDFGIIGSTLFVRKIAVEYGITAIGDYSFYIPDNYPYKFYVQLYNVDISNTVTTIGKYAFYNQQIQEIVIPPSVAHIGENAFKKCASLKRIIYYGNPADLRWDSDAATDTEFSSGMTIHILSGYADRVSEFNSRFAYKHITFVADIDNPYEMAEEGLDRNIAAYYGSVNSNVFGGAAPYIIVGRFDSKKKSVTYGSNGFASCVKIGSKYYVLTDITTGELHEAIIDSTSGKVKGYQAAALAGVTLKISHEYIGTNTVKIIYTLNNTGAALSDVKVGGAGDIKIGADDTAAIVPLNENGEQVGFYMKSGKEFDQSGSDFATLGFIGKNVKIDNTDPDSEAYPDAHFFYGKVDANKGGSAAGAKTVVLIPERVFSMNTGDSAPSQDSGTFDNNQDSGMSYYWDETAVAANATKEYAILFSVYGTNEEESSAEAMITDLSETFHTVTWEDDSNNTIVQQVVKDGETAFYPGATPIKASTAKFDYTFSGWSPDPDDTDITENTIFTAQFTATPRKFFKKHSLSLGGDIGIYYYVDVTVAGLTVDQVKNGTKTVRLFFDSYKDAEYTINGSTDYDTATGCFKAKRTVNAAEMTYNIHTTAYINNTEYTDEYDDFSVRAYGDVVLDESSDFSVSYKTENPEKYAQLKALVIRMLDYGAKAQTAFNVLPNDLANKNFRSYGVTYSMQRVTSAMLDEAIDGPKSNMRAGVGALGLDYAGSSVVFLSKNSLRHYYVFEDQAAFEALTHSDNFTWTYKDPGVEGLYGGYFECADIAAAKLDEPQVFTIGGRSYSYSVLDYAKLMIESSHNMEAADVNLAMATYWYNDAANIFFNDV